MDKSKRRFIKKAGQSSAMLILFAYGGGRLMATEKSIANLEQKWDGMLVKDPRALFDLPNGFSYKVVISSGDLMSDGLSFGKRPDGMAAFELSDGSTALVVNHETKSKDKSLNINTAYDGVNGRAYSGGTSTLVLESDGTTEVFQEQSIIVLEVLPHGIHGYLVKKHIEKIMVMPLKLIQNQSP